MRIRTENMQGLFITSVPLPMRKYIFRMALISFIPSILLAILVSALLAVSGLSNETAGPSFENGDFGTLPVLAFILVVIVSPFIETLFLSFGIWFLSRFVKAKVAVVVISAFVWSCFHSLMFPLWGLVVFWPFVVFSCAYITWRQTSWIKAFWAAFCIHAIQNFIPGIAATILMS
jgi:hypothetical protein